MRIIAGFHKGASLVAPKGTATHPMGDRVRESLFGTLGGRVDGSIVLDLYAGTGAIGLEAESRGAAHVVLVENNQKALAAIRKNLDHLGVSQTVTLQAMSVERFLGSEARNQFDIVFVDPPYDKFEQVPFQKIVDNALTANGLMVLSYPGRASAPKVDGVVVVDTKSFGDSALSFYRQAAEAV